MEVKPMGRTKRVQILMEPEEYRELEEIARQKGVSVAELIRTAVKERYFLASKKQGEAIADILAMNLPVGDWEAVEAEILEAHGDGLS